MSRGTGSGDEGHDHRHRDHCRLHPRHRLLACLWAAYPGAVGVASVADWHCAHVCELALASAATMTRLTLEDIAQLPEAIQRQVGEQLCAQPSREHPGLGPLSGAAGSARFTIPWPPSVNRLHGVLRGKILLTRAGRRYYQDSVQAVSAQLPGRSPPISAPARLYVIAHPPDQRRRDLDNLLKCACDVIQKAGIVSDDAWLHDIRILRGEVRTPAGLICTVEAI